MKFVEKGLGLMIAIIETQTLEEVVTEVSEKLRGACFTKFFSHVDYSVTLS